MIEIPGPEVTVTWDEGSGEWCVREAGLPFGFHETREGAAAHADSVRRAITRRLLIEAISDEVVKADLGRVRQVARALGIRMAKPNRKNVS